jgi:hypothetical protein
MARLIIKDMAKKGKEKETTEGNLVDLKRDKR